MKYTKPGLVVSVCAFGIALTACGDDVTKVTEFAEITKRTGPTVIAKGEKIPDCTKDIEGEVVFVTDSSSVYYCAEGKWSTLKGEDREKGETSAEGKTTNGTSCTAEKKKDGSIDLNCGGELVGTLTSGKGSDGKSAYEIAKANGFTGTEEEWLASLKGESCTIAEAKDKDAGKTGYKVTCNGVTRYIWNGINGKDGEGCSVDESEGDGVVNVICDEGADEKTVILYKPAGSTESNNPKNQLYYGNSISDWVPACGAESYNPVKQMCHEGILYDRDSTSGYNPVTQTLLDARLQTYRAVTIEIPFKNYKQTWMAENLNYDTNTGKENNSWCGGGEYEKEGDCSVYGRLYTWEAAMKACPAGWHLPSLTEWKDLIAAVGGKDVAGTMLKSATSDWNDNGKGRNTYGFSALPAGYGSGSGIFHNAGDNAYFWSASQDGNNSNYAYNMNLGYNYEYVSESINSKDIGHSVRCIKD